MFEAWQAQRKQQIVYEIDKKVASMHTLIFAGGALGAKKWRSEQPTERKEQIQLQKQIVSMPFGGEKTKKMINIA